MLKDWEYLHETFGTSFMDGTMDSILRCWASIFISHSPLLLFTVSTGCWQK